MTTQKKTRAKTTAPTEPSPETPRILAGSIELVHVSMLKTHPENPRQGDIGAIHESIRHNGFYGTIVAQKSTGRILAGNHRFLAAKEAGLDALPVAWVDVDDDTARRIMLVDNRTNDLASYDDESLAKLLSEVQLDTGTLEGTGYDGDVLDDLLRDLGLLDGQEEGETDLTPPAKAKSKRDEVYELGRHRLMCGDATSEDVTVLLSNVQVVTVTDPPYSVDYDRSRGQRSGKESAHGPYHDTDPSSTLRFLKRLPGDVLVMTYPVDRHLFILSAALNDAGLELRKELVWVKDTFSFWPGAKYQQRHEPILICVRRGHAMGADVPANESTVQEFARPRSHDQHCTQKPIELFQKLVRYHVSAGGDVYDPFVGLGTTLIAAEQTGRTCYAMEIEPRYCDVVRKRYADHVGDQKWAP